MRSSSWVEQHGFPSSQRHPAAIGWRVPKPKRDKWRRSPHGKLLTPGRPARADINRFADDVAFLIVVKDGPYMDLFPDDMIPALLQQRDRICEISLPDDPLFVRISQKIRGGAFPATGIPCAPVLGNSRV